jgi:hypothetical protein
MDPKPARKPDTSSVASVAAIVAVVPVLVLCCAGPAVIVPLLAGLGAWLVGLGPVAAAVVLGVSVAFGLAWRSSNVAAAVAGSPRSGCGPPASWVVAAVVFPYVIRAFRAS